MNFAKAYAYAQANGYTGTLRDYIFRQFLAYKAVCERCEVGAVLSYGEWRILNGLEL